MDAPREQQPRAQPGASGEDGSAEPATGAASDADACGQAPAAPNAAAPNAAAPNAAAPMPPAAPALTLDTISGHGATTPGGSDDEPALLAPHTVVGRYIILDHLGSGGMGVVYKAYDPDLNRQIALKLVRVAASRDADPASMRGRLLREAQGLAQLSHPNVVAVYDVGLFEDGVFLAMELVAGPTLRQWLKTEPSYRDKLRVFIAAGEGLAAAHRAGLVHRDVKPDNIILGDDGRPRVLDFGLVRAVGAGPDSSSGLASTSVDGVTGETQPGRRARPAQRGAAHVSSPSLASHASLAPALDTAGSLGASPGEDSGELATPLTRAGTVLGTPRYMSPEQLLGRAVDAKSDQFSFCVALYEGLYGKPPFRGQTVPVLRDNICAGRVRSPPAGARVPLPVRRAILTGLAPDAKQRHPAMAELLAALARDPATTWRRLGLALAAVLVAGLAALALSQRASAADRCQLDVQATRAMWSEASARAIGGAFATTGRPYAADTAVRVGDALGRRATAWGAMQKASCEATWVTGSQSEGLLDLRTECLAERRIEQQSLVELLSRPDADAALVDRAVQAVAGLPAIDRCADAQALRSSRSTPPPGAANEVANLRQRLARLRPRTLAGDYRTAAEGLRAIVEAARELDDPQLVGEASFELAAALRGTGELAASQKALEQTMQATGASGDDRTAAVAAAHWIFVVGYATDRPAEALVAVPVVRTLAARVPDDLGVQAEMHNAVGTLLVTTGDYAGARTEFRHALDLAQRADPAQELRMARYRNNLGIIANYQRDYETAIAELSVVCDIYRRLLAPGHPTLGMAYSNLGRTQAAIGADERATESCRKALRIFESVHGDAHPDVAYPLICMAKTQSELGELDAAAGAAERALRVRERQYGPDHALVGESATVLADVYLKQGKNTEALALYRRAVPAFEPSHPELVEALRGLGRGLSAAGEDREALRVIERAAAFARERELPSAADAEADLARALWRAGDRERARALAERALAAYEAAGLQRDHAELSAWLAAPR